VKLAPVTGSYGSSAVCTDVDDAAALNDRDNKTQPQTAKGQKVEYDHRVATRAIESMTRAKKLGKNFFIAAGLRKPHLAWRVPHKFWAQYEGKTISLAKHMTIGENITVLAYEMNGEMSQVYTKKKLSSTAGSRSEDLHQLFVDDDLNDVGGSTWRESPGGPPIPNDLQVALKRG